MVLRGFAERTKQSYLGCIVALAKHYRRPPDTLDAAAIQAYLLHLITEKKLAYASVNRRRALSAFCLRSCSGARSSPTDPDGQGAQAPAADPHAQEVGRLFAHCRDVRSRTLLMAEVRRWTAAVRGVRFAVDRHRVGPRQDVYQGTPGQGRQGSL